MVPALPILNLLQDCCNPPLTAESLEALQIKLGRTFPRKYADFLLQYNGGRFRRLVKFSIPQPTKYVTAAEVTSFIGEADDRDDPNGLLWWSKILSDRIPPEFLSIAHCNDSDQLLLKLVGPDSRFDGVWYWNSSAFFVSELEQQFYWVADSFHEFLSKLVYDIFDEDERETLPLFQAVERGAITALETYLSQGGDPEAQNEQGHTLLMAAAIHRWPKLVDLLLKHSAHLQARDAQGRTPLHHAAGHSVDSVRLLLAAGADATARDHAGKSVLANWSYRADQLLRRHGAKD